MVYRVFLSSTSPDLAAGREAVKRAISGLDGFSPIVMETFGGRDATARQIDEAKVRECDVFVGLVGHCYGSSPKDNPTSYTEQEFDLASALGRPRLMLVASEEFRLPANLIEREEKRQRQATFRARVLEERVVAMFDDPAGLPAMVGQALANWRAERENFEEITAQLIVAKEEAAKHKEEALRQQALVAEFLSKSRAAQEPGLRATISSLADETRKPEDFYRYDVALSFAGEDRLLARELAKTLQSSGCTVFFDEYEQAALWGKDLYVHLSEVYRDQAKYCVIFISDNYKNKLWTKRELQAAQNRAAKENREYILPVRLDDTEVPGILDQIAYLDARKIPLDNVAALLVSKIRAPRN